MENVWNIQKSGFSDAELSRAYCIKNKTNKTRQKI